nr:MAG: hypothetical protein TU35_05230 [Thermoproteus sp. AZ2]
MRLPPRIKVLEALGAIADGRIELRGDNEAVVTSSEGDRRYRVYVDVARRVAYSDDNGTIYRGYVGYPIISLLMLKGVLPIDEQLKGALRGIPWRRLNEQYKRYEAVMELLKRELSEKGIEPSRVDKYIDLVLAELKRLGLKFAKPPASPGER